MKIKKRSNPGPQFSISTSNDEKNAWHFTLSVSGDNSGEWSFTPHADPLFIPCIRFQYMEQSRKYLFNFA